MSETIPNSAARPWAEAPAATAKRLGTDFRRGLSPDEAARRLGDGGRNRLREERPRSRLGLLLEQFKSPMVLILLGAAVLSWALGEVVDSVAIAAILLVNAGIGYAQQVRAEAAVQALKQLSAPLARVLRDGAVSSVPAEEVVPGDVLVVEAGDWVAADARLFEGSHLSTNEAALTGESLPIEKHTLPVAPEAAPGDRVCMLFAGTTVATGSGRAVVTDTGMNTEIGRIAHLLETAVPGPTPLQIRLHQIGNRLLIVCGALVGLLGVLGLLRGRPWLEVLMVSVSLAVAAIPEGLPTVVTLALALAVRRMTHRKAIVRRLPAVETLGSTDVICTDKTGTLTTGQMQVRELFASGSIVEAAAPGETAAPLRSLLAAATLCSNADLGNGAPTGDPTEIAFLLLAAEKGIDPRQLRELQPRLAEWPFESDRKRMSVAVADGKEIRVHVKGAPETTLPLCLLSDEDQDRVSAALHDLSSRGRRVLAVATRTLDEGRNRLARLPADYVERELRFLGLVALADPPRSEAKAAVRACLDAGIRVVMITGDHPVTAGAIAAEMGIVGPDGPGEVLAGPELQRLSSDDLRERVERIAVYARVTPEQKLHIVRAWKERGKVVAMTGDGVNDAPALREASIGVAMGRGGTEVARQASAMVLSDDNFATIVAAVEEGRGVYGNIQRTIRYLLAGNTAELLVMLGAALAALPAPLLPLHLLWINLVTDGLPTLALAAEPVPAGNLGNGPRPSVGSFGEWRFYRGLLFVGVVAAALALVIFHHSLPAGEMVARSRVFAFFVLEELFRSFSARSDDRSFLALRPNPFHLLAVAVPLGLQGLIHGVPALAGLFHVGPLSAGEWAALAGLALIPLAALELRKVYRRIGSGAQ